MTTKDNYFVIDSTNYLEQEKVLYGYLINDGKTVTDVNEIEDVHNTINQLGCFCFIGADQDEITICQDCSGSFGLYVYNANGYFAISNSFLLLVEHIKDKITLDEDVLHLMLAADLTNLAYRRTMAKEIQCLSQDEYIVIDKKTGKADILGYKQTGSFYRIQSADGLKVLDAWYEKWVDIIRNLFAENKPIDVDLTGGIDSRLVFSLFLNANVDLKRVNVISYKDNSWTHGEDYSIASAIAERFGFVLNQEKKAIKAFDEKDFFDMNLYSFAGCHKQWLFNSGRYLERRYRFTGSSGEKIRGYWAFTRNKLIEYEKAKLKNVYGYDEKTDSAIGRLFEETFNHLKSKYCYSDEKSKIEGWYLWNYIADGRHFGKIAEYFWKCNEIRMQPLTDPLLDKIELIDSENSKDLIAALIFERYCPELLDFHFDSGHKISQEAIDEAKELNRLYPYKHKDIPLLDSYKRIPACECVPSEDRYYMKDGNEFIKHCFFSSKIRKYMQNSQYEKMFLSTASDVVERSWFPYGNAEILLLAAYIMNREETNTFFEFLNNLYEKELSVPIEILETTKKIKELKQRDNFIMGVYSRWVANPFSVKDFLEKNDYKKVGIYGLGRLGKDLLRYLKGNVKGCTVEFVMDRNTDIKVDEIKVLNTQDSIPLCDVIITTVAGKKNEIEKFLKGKTDITVVALEDIVQS